MNKQIVQHEDASKRYRRKAWIKLGEANWDIAIGNLLGSSIYNILLILGITCLVPAHGLTLPAQLVRVDIPIMVAVAVVCIPIFITGRRVSRFEGGAMVAGYVAFLAFLLATQT